MFFIYKNKKKSLPEKPLLVYNETQYSFMDKPSSPHYKDAAYGLSGYNAGESNIEHVLLPSTNSTVTKITLTVPKGAHLFIDRIFISKINTSYRNLTLEHLLINTSSLIQNHSLKICNLELTSLKNCNNIKKSDLKMRYNNKIMDVISSSNFIFEDLDQTNLDNQSHLLFGINGFYVPPVT